MADYIPIGYAIDGDIFCVPCTLESFSISGNPYNVTTHQHLWDIAHAMEDIVADEELNAIYSWDQTDAHGVACATCDEEVSPAWCEAADPSMAGNGFCGECNIEAMDTMGESNESSKRYSDSEE